MDGFILNNTKQSAALDRMRRTFIEGDPAALLCVELYDDDASKLPARLEAIEHDLRARRFGYRYVHALDLPTQATIWSLREAALGLSMAMKDDAKSLSFVEDTAVAPEKLRDYIDRFLAIVKRHKTTAGVYAHASVGCLHVRPVINMKTAEACRRLNRWRTTSRISCSNSAERYLVNTVMGSSAVHSWKNVRDDALRAFRAVKHTFDPTESSILKDCRCAAVDGTSSLR